jgi:thioredoxin reductase
MHDVCIVGAGPAGLNAAIVLGRCGRTVIVLDSGEPRNAVSRGLHGYLTRDGIDPKELRAMGRREASQYPTISFIDTKVTGAQRRDGSFHIVTATGPTIEARKLLLATGRIDVLPDAPGFRTYYGRGVYHCPICDGWEHRNQKLVAYGDCPAAVQLALALRIWSGSVTLCSSDSSELDEKSRRRLIAAKVTIAPAPVLELVGVPGGELAEARLSDGTSIPCQALFFVSTVPQKSALAQTLGCKLDDEGNVICTQHAATGVPGLYVAGNVRGGIHLAIMAAAEGAEAAVAINYALERRRPSRR